MFGSHYSFYLNCRWILVGLFVNLTVGRMWELKASWAVGNGVPRIMKRRQYGVQVWNRVHLEKQVSSQLMKKSPSFYSMWSFITMCATTCPYPKPNECSLRWLIIFKVVLMLTSHLCLSFQAHSFRSSTPKILYAYLLLLMCPTCCLIWSP